MTVFFAGSFDPFTIGHRDIVMRAREIFGNVVIGVGVNSTKAERTSAEERAAQIRWALADESCISVVVYDGLTACAAKEHGATALLRSLRNSTDMTYETPIAEANRREFGIETVFLMATPELAHISSSLVRELKKYGHPTEHLA